MVLVGPAIGLGGADQPVEVVLYELAGRGGPDDAQIELECVESYRLVGAGLRIVALVGVLQGEARVEPGGVRSVVIDRQAGRYVVGRIKVLAERQTEAPDHRI